MKPTKASLSKSSFSRRPRFQLARVKSAEFRAKSNAAAQAATGCTVFQFNSTHPYAWSTKIGKNDENRKFVQGESKRSVQVIF